MIKRAFTTVNLTRNRPKWTNLNELLNWMTTTATILIAATAFLQEGDAGRPNTVYCKNRGFFQGQEDANSGYKEVSLCDANWFY